MSLPMLRRSDRFVAALACVAATLVGSSFAQPGPGSTGPLANAGQEDSVATEDDSRTSQKNTQVGHLALNLPLC